MNATLLLAIAAGGAIGSVGRHLVVLLVGRMAGTDWPWGTLTVNVAGGFGPSSVSFTRRQLRNSTDHVRPSSRDSPESFRSK